tara:strand:- start:26614 stop:27540 length:927 start_codon:yes stop_codon:yes gene_type:complete
MKKLKSSIKKILFTGGGGVGNELIWRVLNRKYQLFFCDSNINKISSIIPKKNIFKVPNVNSKNYIKNVQNICRYKKINLVVPGIDEELKLFKNNSKKFENLFLPSKKMIKICNDKWLFYKFILEKKLNVPKTSLAKHYNPKNHDKNVLIKPKDGRGSRGIFYSTSVKITYLYLKILKIKNLLDNYIVQDYIKGDEFTVTHFHKKKSFIFPLKVKEKKGITIRAKTSKNKFVIKFCKKISKIFNQEMIFNSQLIKNKKNKVFLIEINPRVSTTFCFLIANNYDPFSDKFLINKKDKFSSLYREINNLVK